MLRGEKVALRVRHEDDVPVLHAELYDDIPTQLRADTRVWRPLGVAVSPLRVGDDAAEVAIFSVVRLADGELAGSALLWRIDLHNRSAHLGLSMRPGMRGQGLGVDTVRVLTDYGFRILGLQRLQIDTLADNAAMLAAAESAGYVREGTLRRAAWVSGVFLDEVVLGQLASEWTGQGGVRPS